MKQQPIFVTGIGTGVGKTLVAAVLTEYLHADYWKPVQAGDIENSDSNTVRKLISGKKSVIHPERYLFSLAASPHKAARFAGVHLSPEDFTLPETDNLLIIEGAGGLMVPLSESLLMIDLIRYFEAGALLVVRNYLGCINHSLLSYEMLRTTGIPLTGIVINGDMDHDTYDILRSYIPVAIPFWHVPEIPRPSRKTVTEIAGCFNGILNRTTHDLQTGRP